MSPGLDYKRDVKVAAGGVSIREAFGRPPVPSSFYDGSSDRRTVECPDCSKRADALFGDHGGDCLPTSPVAAAARPVDALGVIRRHALRNGRFSANDVRAALDDAGVKPTSRGPAFAAAERRGWIENDGYVRSTDQATKGHPVAVYRSLIYREAAA